MPLTQTETDRLIEIMRAAARAQVLPRFRNLSAAEIDTKSGPTDLVTLADTEAERAMTEALRAAWPGIEVVGEEAIAADPALRDRIGTAPRVVVLDPIDGTWNFAKGLALFGMIAAVVEGPDTVAGVLYDPVLDDWIMAGAEGPAVICRPDAAPRPLRCSEVTAPEAVQGFLPLGLLPRDKRAAVAASTTDFSRVYSLRCSCHEYRMLAQGHAEFCMSGPAPHAWDHAAGALIVARAGGVTRMLDGTPYHAGITEGYVLTAASEPVWQMVAERFAFLNA